MGLPIYFLPQRRMNSIAATFPQKMKGAVSVDKDDERTASAPTLPGTEAFQLEAETPNVGESDAELVARVRGGDETAFEELFNRHRRRVAFVAGRFFQRREQIEDVVQETFVKAFFALSAFGGSNDKSFPAWLAAIATNAAYDELRRAKRRPESELTEADARELSSSLRAGNAEANIESEIISRDLASKLLARLSPEDRLVLSLLNGEEASASEVAQLTGWSIAKVKVRAHRARAALRRNLSKFL